jgi:uncharacterized protein involved in cysteine biosynthesis
MLKVVAYMTALLAFAFLVAVAIDTSLKWCVVACFISAAIAGICAELIERHEEREAMKSRTARDIANSVLRKHQQRSQV